jgi:hypothetical protein
VKKKKVTCKIKCENNMHHEDDVHCNIEPWRFFSKVYCTDEQENIFIIDLVVFSEKSVKC